MTWNPNATVTIGGVDFTGDTLGGLAIHYGRPTIWDQARASYATVSILNSTDTDYAFEINDTVVIEIQDSDGTDITVFTGKVTDISNELAAAGSGATVAVQTLTAVGPFAQMARTIVGTTNYPKEYDDERISRILTEAGVTVDVVDTPGVYELQERPADPQDAYTLSTYYAGMCFGYMYETKAGAVGYANESRRTVDVENNGYLDIAEGYINWRGINSRKSISDIVNRIILFYKNGQSVTSEDTHSITNYGLIEARVDTELEDADQAQNISERYVSLRSIPETNFSSFSINLDNPNITAVDLDALINIEMGTAVQISDLPNAISPITYTGFVEGWDLVINQYQALLTLTTSDSTYSVVPIRWQDVDPTTQWDDLDPSAVKTTRTNLIRNGNFEQNVTGWNSINANTSFSQNTSNGYLGTDSLELVSLVTSQGNGIVLARITPVSRRIAMTPGDTIHIQGWAKRLVGSRNMRLNIYTYQTLTSTTVIENITGTVTTLNSSTWTKLQVTATPTNVNSLFFTPFFEIRATGAVNDSILIDAVIAELNASGYSAYFWDGDMSDIPANRNPELAWTGTQGDSTSTAEAYFGDIPTLTWANVDTVGLP